MNERMIKNRISNPERIQRSFNPTTNFKGEKSPGGEVIYLSVVTPAGSRITEPGIQNS